MIGTKKVQTDGVTKKTPFIKAGERVLGKSQFNDETVNNYLNELETGELTPELRKSIITTIRSSLKTQQTEKDEVIVGLIEEVKQGLVKKDYLVLENRNQKRRYNLTRFLFCVAGTIALSTYMVIYL